MLTAQSQAKAADLRGSRQSTQDCSDVLNELKENISPLRPKPTRTVEAQNVVMKNVVDCVTAGSHLLIVEDMGTPLRRTTFVRDGDHGSPKCVTRTPERRAMSVGGFRSSMSSPQAVPDCYATPVRRTTFVKNSPKLKLGGHAESSSLFGILQQNGEMNVIRPEDSVPPGGRPETTVNSCTRHLKSDDPLRDVSRSPLILEDRLLHLQNANDLDMLHVPRPRSISASNQVSPSESEYHTAVTTPYDESFSNDEDANEFVDSNICSETITGDVSLCQQQLALKAGRDITFVNNDYTLVATMGVEDSKPVTEGCVDYRPLEYEVQTEVVTEVWESDEFYVTEIISSVHTEAVEPDCTSAGLGIVVCEHDMADFEYAGNEQQFFHSSRRTIPVDDVQYDANVLSNGCTASIDDGCFSATQYQSTPLLNDKWSGIGTTNHISAPVIDSSVPQTATSGVDVPLHKEKPMCPAGEKVDGLLCIPADSDASCIFRSQTFTKICATPSFPADVSEDVDSYNRTYTKSANSKTVTSLSGSRPASRPLFTDNTSGTNSTEDGSTGVVPLDVSQSGFHENTVVPPEALKPNLLTKPAPVEWNKSGMWTHGGMSVIDTVIDTGVFTRVGGQTRHMISPGQKRQSLIARLDGSGQCPSMQSIAAVVNVEHGKREWLEGGDGSPVRKRPFIAASKSSEFRILD